jgi:putative membrane protein
MAISQSFVGFIPSIFLGAPDEDTVLSVLPSHKLLLEGRGMEAVRITGLASLYGVILSTAMLPLAFLLVPITYDSARNVILPLLGFAMIYLILRERKSEKILWALATFLISGYLGWVCLDIKTMSTSQVFLPMFSGLFGLGTLLTGITAGSKSYPQDLKAEVKICSKGLWRGSLLGTLGGFLVGLLPAMSPSQIGIVFQEILALKEKARQSLEEIQVRRFLVIIGSLNTADSMFSIFSLYLIGNPRSGVSVIMQDLFGDISIGVLAMLAGAMLVSGLITYKIHIFLGEKFSLIAGRLDFKKLSLFGFVFVVVLVFAVSGPLGLAIAFVSMLVGLVPALTGVSRTHCMGCLLLPTLLVFAGIN